MALYLISLIQLVVWIVAAVLILNSLISFTPLEPWHPVRRILNQLAEPIVRPFRNIVPPTGMIDFTPMIALVVVIIVGRILEALVQSVFH